LRCISFRRQTGSWSVVLLPVAAIEPGQIPLSRLETERPA
jgi:hypothetical protein